MRFPWPRSLAGETIALLLAALAVAHLFSAAVFFHERRAAIDIVNEEFIVARVGAVVRVLADTPHEYHARIAQAASSRRLAFAIDAEPAPGTEPTAGAETGLERELRGVTGAGPVTLRLGRATSGATAFSVRLRDGAWLNVSKATRLPYRLWAWPSLVSLGFAAVLLSLVVVLRVRRTTRPLASLVAAADALGRGEYPEPLPEDGAEDLRRVTRAFNRMSERLRRFIEDRTRMLAAVSHDLRTPITALRLRAEFVADDENRERILETLEEMERMTEAALAFLREEAQQEPTRPVDLASLVQSLCEDLAEMGMDVACTAPDRLPYACRPLALKRAVRNVVENAVAYGARARVRVHDAGDGPSITVEDDGPGIPDGDHERVFEPFVRLERSRSQATGGIGLGMAIARTVMRGHGGDIALENRAGGGLRVRLHLPAGIERP